MPSDEWTQEDIDYVDAMPWDLFCHMMITGSKA